MMFLSVPSGISPRCFGIVVYLFLLELNQISWLPFASLKNSKPVDFSLFTIFRYLKPESRPIILCVNHHGICDNFSLFNTPFLRMQKNGCDIFRNFNGFFKSFRLSNKPLHISAGRHIVTFRKFLNIKCNIDAFFHIFTISNWAKLFNASYFCARARMQETQTVWPSRVAIYLLPQEQTSTALRVGLYTHLPGWLGLWIVLIVFWGKLFFILFWAKSWKCLFRNHFPLRQWWRNEYFQLFAKLLIL